MEITREQIIEYLYNLSHKDRHKLISLIDKKAKEKDEREFEEDRLERHRKSLENRKKYELLKEQKIKKGESLKEIVKVGDIIKCEGTKDGHGMREVISKNVFGVECRKLKKFRGSWKRDSYITNHGWEKVVKILENFNIY
ncbi:hypothetical protein KY334_02730 [Candidatus Woesearchaeota archaeon]|nr:hypothetical protein [Candidatus Woesearchaeota archaeon]